MKLISKSVLLFALLLCAGKAVAQSLEKDHVAVLELGGAGFWSIKDGTSSFGPSVAVEVTPIENWLELEFGTTALFRRRKASVPAPKLDVQEQESDRLLSFNETPTSDTIR